MLDVRQRDSSSALERVLQGRSDFGLQTSCSSEFRVEGV